MGNLSRDSFDLRLGSVQHVKPPDNSEGARTCLQPFDLLFSITAEIGLMGLIPKKFGRAFINQHTAMIRFTRIVRGLFLPYVLLAPHMQRVYHAGKHGLKSSFRLDTISSFIIPLPPLSEQHRIVAKIEELMSKVGEYAKAAQQLTKFETRFPTDLKRAILQSAVEGKLVPQDPKDEPAYILVERIAEERKALVKAGKLKRDKHESVIFRGSDRLTYETRDGETVCIEDQLPFNIPENWAWVRLESVATIIRGSGIKRDEIVPVGVPCIRYGELYTTYRTQISAIVSHTTKAVASRAKPIKHGDVILTLTGENKEDIGTAAAYLGENDAVVGGDVAVLEDHHCDPLWLSYFLSAPFAVGQKAGMSNGDIIVHLSAQSVASIMVPLPPLAEQKRIVAQIEKMLKASATLTT